MVVFIFRKNQWKSQDSILETPSSVRYWLLGKYFIKVKKNKKVITTFAFKKIILTNKGGGVPKIMN